MRIRKMAKVLRVLLMAATFIFLFTSCDDNVQVSDYATISFAPSIPVYESTERSINFISPSDYYSATENVLNINPCWYQEDEIAYNELHKSYENFFWTYAYCEGEAKSFMESEWKPFFRGRTGLGTLDLKKGKDYTFGLRAYSDGNLKAENLAWQGIVRTVHIDGNDSIVSVKVKPTEDFENLVSMDPATVLARDYDDVAFELTLPLHFHADNGVEIKKWLAVVNPGSVVTFTPNRTSDITWYINGDKVGSEDCSLPVLGEEEVPENSSYLVRNGMGIKFVRAAGDTSIYIFSCLYMETATIAESFNVSVYPSTPLNN